MNRIKCSQCGCVNWLENETCKRCRTPLASPPVAPSPNRFAAKPHYSIYGVAFFAGIGVCLATLVSKLALYPTGVRFPLSLLVWCLFATTGIFFGTRRHHNTLLMGASLSVCYVVLSTWSLVAEISYNQQYVGQFWINRFFFWPVIPYLLPPVVVTLAAYLGSRRSFTYGALLVATLATCIVAIVESRPGQPHERKLSHSLDVVAGESQDTVLRLNLILSLSVQDDPPSFRAIPSTSDNWGHTITVIKRGPAFKPDTQLAIEVDGRLMHNSAWPVGVSRVTFTGNEDYSGIVNWKVGTDPKLMRSLTNARRIEMDWGNLHIVLSDEQVEGIRNFVRNWVSILQEEGVFCTNPMCKPDDAGRRASSGLTARLAPSSFVVAP